MTATAKLDRNSAQIAGEIIEALIPEKEDRAIVLRFFAASIQLAHQLAPDKWSVTLTKNFVRLNVGMIEVGGIFRDRVHLVLDQSIPAVAAQGDDVVENRSHSYKSVPCYFWNFDASKAAEVLPGCSLSHRALIENAARTRRNAAAPRAHSPGVLRYVEQELGETLPNPVHETPRESLGNIVNRTGEEHPGGQDDNGPMLERSGESRLPEEVPSGSAYREGGVRQILVNRYERDPRAREECIRRYGPTCFICGFDFVAAYGRQMEGFTHVHHLKPLSSVGADYEVDPIVDLRPVCPNCHAVVHRREPPFSLDEVKQFLQKRGGHS